MTTKSTKRALLVSVLSLFICFTMLLGTSYAWFSDTVTSTGNIIKTGTLDVTLEYKKTPSDEKWVDASTGAIFQYHNWEPGYTEVRYVKIANIGSLDLKFMLNIIPNEEPAADEPNLADVIDVYMVPVTDETALPTIVRAADMSDCYVGTLSSLMAEADGAAHGVLYADDDDKAGNVSEVYAIVLKMQESAGNEYQNRSVGGGFTVQLYAAQFASETDDLGAGYDDGAMWPGEVSNAEELKAALKEGGSIKVIDDITLTESVEVPAGVKAVLDLNGYSITVEDGFVNSAIDNYGTLTINGDGVIDVSATTSKAQAIDNYGTLTVNGGTYKGSESSTSYTVRDYGYATVNNAELIGGFGGIAVQAGGNTVINDGTYTMTGNGGGHVFVVYNTGSLVIEDGSFNGDIVNHTQAYDYLIYTFAGSSVEIKGGAFEKFVNAFSGDKPVAGDLSLVEISGGTFAVDPEKYGTVAEGCIVKANDDGTYTVISDTDEWDGTADTSWYPEFSTLSSERRVFNLYTAEELAGLAVIVNSGVNFADTTINLMVNVDLKNLPWTPIGGDGHGFNGELGNGADANRAEFNGNNKTIKNLNVDAPAYAGLFGFAQQARILNVNIEGVEINTNHYAGAVLAQGCAVKIGNCNVKDATITCSAEEVSEGKWDNGDKVGGIIGQMTYGISVTSCTVEDATITGYRDVGGILGYAGANTTVTGNATKNVTLVLDNAHNYKNYTTDEEYDVNEIIGDARQSGIVDSSNSVDGREQLPVADVTILEELTESEIEATLGMGGDNYPVKLDVAYEFKTTDTYTEAQASAYKYWHADFVVSVDKDVAPMSVALAGYYAAYCEDYNDGKWVALASDEAITANTEIRLLDLMLGGGSMSYQELCNWVPEFLCGAVDLTGENAGTTLTVELRLYEVEDNTASTANETGHYETIGKYTYTFKERGANIGDQNYDSLAAAVEAAQPGDTVVMNEDVDKLPLIDKAITIDGNGFSVAQTMGEAQFGAIDGTVTLKNITFEDGDQAIRTDYGSADYTNLTLVIENCKFNNLTTYAIMGGSTSTDASEGKSHVLKRLEVIECEFNVSGDSYNNYMVYSQAVTELVVTGCTFNGNNVSKGAIHTGDSVSTGCKATISDNEIDGFARGIVIANRTATSKVSVSSNTFTNITLGAVYVHGNADGDVSISVTKNSFDDIDTVIYNDGNGSDINAMLSNLEDNNVNGTVVSISFNENGEAMIGY